MEPLDLAVERKKLDEKLGRPATDTQFASYLMYPKVFLDYAKDRANFGDCAVLPTPVFFYGMEAGEEVSIDIERGKTLIVRFVTTSDVHDDGTRTVFFELNGQPRSVTIADRSQVARRPPQRKVEAGNPKHVGAPMPGTVATVKAIVGQKIAKGDLLLTMEAMKMETSVRADVDGTVAEVLAKPGLQVDAKDLLVVLS
jgi:pyruvate carboxylase